MTTIEDLNKFRIQIGAAVLEMKYIFDEGKLKRDHPFKTLANFYDF